MQRALAATENLDIYQDGVDDLLVEKNEVIGIVTGSICFS